MEGISTVNYLKILDIMDDLINTSDVIFQQQVLSSLDKYFGFNQANFWICDSENNLKNPIMLNGNEKAMDDYLKNYYHMDFLIPQKVKNLLFKKRVIRITDILTPSTYEKSEFYNSFMKKYGIYHMVGIYLHDGKKLLGLIDFTRSKSDKPFSNSDVRCLEIISRYLSQKTKNFLQSKEIHSINQHLASTPQNLNKIQDEKKLTNKEIEVLELVMKGHSNTEIADCLFVSTNTIKKHLQSIYRKCNVSNRTSLCYSIHQIND